jgi:hypothetical protein
MVHEISKLPLWAQELLIEKEEIIRSQTEQMNNLRIAHAVLFEYESWGTIHGPLSGAVDADGGYRLFFLSSSGAHPVCSLSTGDILLFGRKKRN